jgi:hypothetical protein
MAPRAPGVHTHEEWKGMAQPVGLVVEPVVLNRLGVFPESATTVLADWQQRLEQLLEDQPVGEQWLSMAPSFELFCQEVLAWQPGDLRKPEELAAPVAVALDDYDEVLHPDWVVPEPSQGDGPLKAQLLVQELPLGTPFDALPKGANGRRCWEATPQQRLERLLKESEHPIGLLWNGVALRLVYAPRGESSGHLTFPLEPMTTVDGRPMLAALQMLLGPDRLFEGGASNTRLRPLMEQSRKEQNEVSTRLAEQVLEALWILLRGFDAAGLKVDDPSHIYGGLITVLLRLVFLLYAEDEELMPTDSLYGQHYSVGGLAQRLRQDRTDYQNAMEGRRGAWATLLSLFRLVYDGGGPSEAYLPARHGDLFDPDAYPFLEGRTADTSYTDGPLTSVPAISDDVVEQVLTKLLLLDGQILSYRALDVEQIGSVYEGIMGFMVEKATGPSVGITYRPPRQKITITVVVAAEALLAVSGTKRQKWLDDQAGVALKLPAKAKKGLKEATSMEELCAALGNRLSPHTPRGMAPGSLILQPTAERRRSGSHYTPRMLTEPIVAEALRPWLESCKGKPTAQQILALKLCDPAMGSGAFLVAVCRFLAGWLVQAWEDPDGPGFPPDFKVEWDKDLYARRLIAQRCLYGVDKNPFAVNLAKLSLWLVTLSKELPFTFVDHALKCGDSLVGYSVQEIQAAMKEVQLGFLNEQNEVLTQMGLARRECFAVDSVTDDGYDRKKELLQQQIHASDGLRQAGDLMAAAFFDAPKTKDRADKQQVYLALLSGAFNDNELQDSIQEIRRHLAAGDKGIKPFHWQLEFPEVFCPEQGGFNAIIGNPPFAGSVTLAKSSHAAYTDWLRSRHAGSAGKCDLVAFFFRSAFGLLCRGGALGFITTNTVSQGDTRRSGLFHILQEDGWIYAARKRVPWPGIAAVVVSIVHISKASMPIPRLNGRQVKRISAYLLPGTIDGTPLYTGGLGQGIKAGLGSKPNGKGFIFSDRGSGFLPVNEAHSIISRHPECCNVIKPYMGGSELNKSPNLKSDRWIIDFGDLSMQEAMKYEEPFALAVERVKPFVNRKNWWQFEHRAKDILLQIRELALPMVLVVAETSDTFAPVIIDSSNCFSNKVVIFTTDDHAALGVLQSRFHEYWCRTVSCTLKDDLTYVPSACHDTFPVPFAWNQDEHLRLLARDFDTKRLSCLSSMGIGLTSLYNKIHSPRCRDNQIAELRVALDAIDYYLASLYGFDELDLKIDFYELPSDDLSEEEVDDDENLSANWRYGWSESSIDEAISILMRINEQIGVAAHKARAKVLVENRQRKDSRTSRAASSSQLSFNT